MKLKHKKEAIYQMSGQNDDRKVEIAELIGIDTGQYDIQDPESMWKLYDKIEEIVITKNEIPEDILDKVLIKIGINNNQRDH